MSLYNKLKTSSRLEVEGVTLEIPETCRVTLARAGGSNMKFVKAGEAIQRKYGRLMSQDLMSSEKGKEVLYELYADNIVLNWESWQDGKWVEGIESETGELLPVTAENVIITFNNLPDLFAECMNFAEKPGNYRQSFLDDALKN